MQTEAGREVPDFQDNQAQLQSESLKLIALVTAVLGYAWFVWIVPPFKAEPFSAWLGMALLVVASGAGYLLKDRHLRIATHILLWGIFAAVALAMIAFQSLIIAFAFIVPVAFASVLLGQPGVFSSAALASILIVTIGRAHLGHPVTDMLLPVAVVAMVSIACWLSARNLYVALAWVWSGYEQALAKERIVRDRQAELHQTLKALDEATYRLERTNHMLALARDEAEEARRLKQHFVQTISHELRTPLNLIVGFTDLMVEAPEYYGVRLSPTYVRDLSIVHRNARHLQSLVNDVLDLARIEAAQMSLSIEPSDPAVLVQDAVDMARSLVESCGLALHIQLEPGLPVLQLDPTRIRQVLFNLLSNAARFTERGSVSVSVARQGKVVTFAVADTGIGIEPHDMPRIFQEFHQLDGSMRRPHGGAGLGLAISRRFVELHGGRIWAESRVGHGSTFSFSLPISHDDDRVAAVGALDKPPGSIRRGSGEERILLAVTRSPGAATLLTRYIRGYRTVVVQDLGQARRVAEGLLPQGVIIDTALQQAAPEFLQQLEHWPLPPRTPFIACPLPGEDALAQRLAVEGYMVKPVSRQSLWDMLRQFGERVDRVLLIDDDRDFALMLSRMLENPVRPYQVMDALTGSEGIEMIRHHRPDLVLLDLMLPDMHGTEVIRRIRSNPAWRCLPIVVVSAQDGIDTRTLAGSMVIAKTGGLMPGEVVRWTQTVLDTAERRAMPGGST
jgi:signal transduction histidine kinase/CheY-like chemotaxis protein